VPSEPRPSRATDYEIRVRGHLDARWSESFPGLELEHRVDRDGEPVTVLGGPVADNAELHGLLARIRDLGIQLLAVRSAPGRESAPPGPAAGADRTSSETTTEGEDS
jgi:hypothetical protein